MQPLLRLVQIGVHGSNHMLSSLIGRVAAAKTSVKYTLLVGMLGSDCDRAWAVHQSTLSATVVCDASAMCCVPRALTEQNRNDLAVSITS